MPDSGSSSKELNVTWLCQKGRLLLRRARVFAFLLLATCLIPVVAEGGEYRVVADKEFSSSDPLPTVYSLKKMSNGGYLILGNGASWEIRLLRIADGGDLSWEKRVPARRYAKHRPSFAIESDDGGFWIVGAVSEFEYMSDLDVEQIFKTDRERFHRFREVPFLSKFDVDGNLQWRNPLGMLKQLRESHLVCGVRVDDGLILVGTKYRRYEKQPPTGGAAIVSHPWIAKVNMRGDLVWERFLPGDDNNVLSAMAVHSRECGGPYAYGDGSVVFGLRVVVSPSYVADGVRIVTGMESKGVHSYLIAQLDQHGNELRRALLLGESHGALTRNGDGLIAVANLVEGNKALSIRRTWLNPDLSVRQRLDTPLAYSLALHGATPGPNRGVHLLGDFQTERTTGWAVTQLSSSGHVTGTRALTVASASWNLRGHAAHSETELAVVLHGDSVVKFLRFKYEQ